MATKVKHVRTSADDDSMLQMYKEGATLRDIASVFDVSANTVSRHLSRFGDTYTKLAITRKLNRKRRRVDPDRIKYLRSKRYTYQQIADEFGVSRATISHYLNHRGGSK